MFASEVLFSHSVEGWGGEGVGWLPAVHEGWDVGCDFFQTFSTNQKFAKLRPYVLRRILKHLFSAIFFTRSGRLSYTVKNIPAILFLLIFVETLLICFNFIPE